MGEILYKRSQAVAGLNHVEGFNPLELARVIQKEGQEDQYYLDVKFRKLWFRLCNPNGKISKKLLTFNDNMAILEARVYLDKNDPEECYVGSGFSQKFRTDDPGFGEKFLETAETAASGRALAEAGFGIQFAESEETDREQVDAGIPVPKQNVNAGGYPNMPEPAQNQQMFQNQQAPQGMAPLQNFPQNSGGTNSQRNYAQNQNAQRQGNVAQGAAVQIDSSQTVDTILKQLTYEQAKAVVISSGVHSGKTMGQLAIENPSSLDWFTKGYRGPNNLLRAAAWLLLQQAA